jgi:hypothetical protein
MRHFEDDYETEAIEKCSRALSRLDDRAKIRVIRYMLDKYGLLAETEPKKQEVANTIIHNQQNNLVLAEPKDSNVIGNSLSNTLSNGNQIALKDVLIRGLAKSEPELIVVIGFYNSNFGRGTFTRQSILDSYRENNIYTQNRRKNLVQNLSSLIKKSLFDTITDEELSISQDGCEYAQNILSGNSTTKKRKPRNIKKTRSTKNVNEDEIDSDSQYDLGSDE